jgi:2-polyprenyl-3-methyl-5-hydroxy-6-metoxy-1,4-benzoquinol methylase
MICGNSLKTFKTLYDDRFGYPGTFSILSCEKCGHKSLDAQFSAEELGKLYTEYYCRSHFTLDQHHPHTEESGIGSWLDGSRSFAFRWVPQNVRVLDIGCGFGETLGYHKTRGCDVYGVEADENVRRFAEKYGYNVQVGLFNPKYYEPAFFDYVTLDQVIEHVPDPIKMLKEIGSVMKRNGILILSTPNSSSWASKLFGRRWINWHTPFHLQIFSKKSIGLVADQAGFTLEQTRTITSSDWLCFQWIHLLLFPKMGEPSPFWTPNQTRDFKQKIFLELLRIIHMTKINHLITRFFDALGVGDNTLLFLRKK